MSLSSQDILFVGKGVGVVPWYRTGMPSFHLGCDWVAMIGKPPNLRMDASLKRGGNSVPKLDDYKIVVLQQVSGREWFHEIMRLKKLGIKIIYEVDDYLHSVRKVKGHRAAEGYTKKRLTDYELCMRACNAMIVSTPWLAEKYRRFNKRVYVCRNGIDAKRYGKFLLPTRTTFNIGWGGGEGHLESVRAWLPAIEAILDDYEDARFISMGLPIANLLKRPKQAVALPFISIENYAPALTNFDIAIGPAARTDFFAAKSDLRFLETGALGIPLVADPFVYSEIEHGQTGLLAENSQEAEDQIRKLIEFPRLCHEIAYNAKDYVQQNRDIDVMIEQWERVFVEVGLGKKAVA